MKIFLSCSFSTKVDYNTGEVLLEFRRELESILGALRVAGHTVFAAIEDEDWKIGNKPPKVGAQVDINQINKSDVLLALLHDSPSAGVQWEIGYANALKIPVFIASQDGSKLAYWNQGLVGLKLVEQIDYDVTDSFKKLVSSLSSLPQIDRR